MSEPMTTEELDALRELEKAATPGPWSQGPDCTERGDPDLDLDYRGYVETEDYTIVRPGTANPSAYARHAYASWVLVCSLDEPEAARGRVGMFGRFSRLDGPPYWRC